jgi:hypothetical protein
MWGVFVLSLRYVAERNNQTAEQQAALAALEAPQELAGVAGQGR